MEYVTQFYTWSSEYVNWGLVILLVLCVVVWRCAGDSTDTADKPANVIESLRDYAILKRASLSNELEMLNAFKDALMKEFPIDGDVRFINEKIAACESEIKNLEQQILDYNYGLDCAERKEVMEEKLRQYKLVYAYAKRKS